MRVAVLLTVVSLLVALPVREATADVRELKQSELRKATLSGNTIRLARVIKGVAKTYGGTPVDARAFQAGEIYYRILVKKPDGKIVSVIVNAQTGAVVSNRSGVGNQISKAARSNSTKANSNRGNRNGRGSAANRNNGNAGGNGNGSGGGGGNAGGNSGSNSGGNSGGNGGGNAGGNSGGNGGGNSGGNGKGRN